MSSLHKITLMIAAAGALACIGSTATVTSPLRAEARPAVNAVEGSPVQLHCRLYFGCAPLAHAGRKAAQPEQQQ